MHGRRAPDVGCTCIRFKHADELENHSSVVWTNCYSYFPVLNSISNFNKMTQLCYYFWCCSIKLAKLRDECMTKKVFDHFNLNSFIHSWGRRQIAFNWKCGLILAFFWRKNAVTNNHQWLMTFTTTRLSQGSLSRVITIFGEHQNPKKSMS